MVLPNSIWKGPDAKAPVARTKIQKVHKVGKNTPPTRAHAQRGATPR
jgi:hypothetical protein